MPPVPGRGDTVIDGVREKGDGSRNFVPGEADESDPLQGVWG